MTRIKQNHKIAEWLYGDIFCQCITDDYGRSIHGYCKSNEGFASIHQIGGCWACNKIYQHSDFFNSDTASLKILESLPLGTRIERMKIDAGWFIFVPGMDVMRSLDYQVDDFKIVVAQAALCAIKKGLLARKPTK